MAAKSKKRRSVAQQFAQARRSLEKGQFKQALKAAKVCHRQQPCEEHRGFLERAYFARGDELYRAGLRDEGRAVVQSLLDLGVTDPSVQRDLSRLLIALGMLSKGGGPEAEEHLDTESSLLLAAADHAVLRPDETPTSLPEICQGALHVRAALEALENGEQRRPIELLGGISRRSPLADWKYFVRGLAAYYRQDTAEMQANWDRLDPDRFAARIAAPLIALDRSDPVDPGDHRLAYALLVLEEAVVGGPISGRLYSLQAHVAADRWREALRVLKKSEKTLRRLDPDLLERIFSVLYSTILHKDSRRWLSGLTAAVPPPPIDPQWNRARALFSELSREDRIGNAESHWLAYLDDLAELPCLTPEERILAQALVWLQIGKMFATEGDVQRHSFYPLDEYVEQCQARATDCFANSLELAPTLRSAYEALAKLQLDCDLPQEAAGTYRRLLDQFPDDLDALLRLVDHHVKRDEPCRAQEYVRRAHRLKPLDKKIEGLIWSTHLGAARQHALVEQWDKGRAEFAAAEKLAAKHPERHALLVRRAALEFKAGDLVMGQRYLRQAQSLFQQPTPALLAAAIEATRYAVPTTIQAELDHEWKVALKKRCHSDTAGAMAKTMAAYWALDVDYPGRSEHIETFLAYIRRCSRVKWKSGDLRSVCQFLDSLCRESDPPANSSSSEYQLLEKYVRKGQKQFPQSAYFQLAAGNCEVNLGPVKCNRGRVQQCFQRALELAEASDDPEDDIVAETARNRLTFLAEMGPDPDVDFPMPDFPMPDFPMPDFFDDEDDEDGPFFEGLPPGFMRILTNMCEEQGIDPEDALRYLMKIMPHSQPGAPTAKSQSRRSKKNNYRR